MEFADYVRIFREHLVLIAVSVALALSVAVIATLRTTPQYSASITMLVSAPDRRDDAGSAYQATLLSQQRVKSYADLLESQRVAKELAAGGGGLSARQLQQAITAEIVPDTVLLRATITDQSAARARAYADRLGVVFAGLIDAIERPVAGGGSPVKITVVDGPETPREPIAPRPLLNLALGLLAGLAAGYLAAILRDATDTSVKSSQALQDASGGAVLGVIGFERGAQEAPLIVQAPSGSVRAEAYRSLRTNLQFADVDNPPKSVVVTSCAPGEGKSTTACNLAITMAQAGWRVVLVEADLRRPRLSDYLGIERSAGLTSVLIGAVAIEDVLQPWGRNGLSVLPSGPVPPNPSELLASQVMRRTVADLTEFAEFVVIDAPPMLAVTDAALLARICDGTILMARHGRTRREQVSSAVEQLRNVDARLLGTVLNFVPSRTEQGYTYGYASEVREPSWSGHARARS